MSRFRGVWDEEEKRGDKVQSYISFIKGSGVGAGKFLTNQKVLHTLPIPQTPRVHTQESAPEGAPGTSPGSEQE